MKMTKDEKNLKISLVEQGLIALKRDIISLVNFPFEFLEWEESKRLLPLLFSDYLFLNVFKNKERNLLFIAVSKKVIKEGFSITENFKRAFVLGGFEELEDLTIDSMTFSLDLFGEKVVEAFIKAHKDLRFTIKKDEVKVTRKDHSID